MMRLFVTPTSPYVRQCRIVVRERWLQRLVEEQRIADPLSSDADYLAINPAGHGPALMVNERLSLFGAPAICAYLDTIGQDPPLIDANWRAQRRWALGNAATELAVRIAGSSEQTTEQPAALARCLDQMELDPPPAAPLNMAAIASAVCVRYVRFRVPHLAPASRQLQTLCDALEARSSFRETAPC